MPEMSEDAGAYFGALTSVKTLTLVAIVEIVAGLALIFNRYGTLLAIILMSIGVNAVLFHATLDPGGIAGVAVFFNTKYCGAYRLQRQIQALAKITTT